jgi:hypothetical protein
MLNEKGFAPVLCSTLLTRSSERFQPCDQIGIATPFRGVPVSYDLRFCFCYGLAFCFQINGKVLVRRVNAGVSKPVSDGAEVNARTQQMDSSAVAQAVGVKTLVLWRWVALGCFANVFPQDQANAETR